jgi:hypothetical protein
MSFGTFTAGGAGTPGTLNLDNLALIGELDQADITAITIDGTAITLPLATSAGKWTKTAVGASPVHQRQRWGARKIGNHRCAHQQHRRSQLPGRKRRVITWR